MEQDLHGAGWAPSILEPMEQDLQDPSALVATNWMTPPSSILRWIFLQLHGGGPWSYCSCFNGETLMVMGKILSFIGSMELDEAILTLYEGISKALGGAI